MIGLRRPKITTPGWDVAGTIEKVGASVTDLRPGDEVMGTVEGSFAELAAGRPDKLVPKPARAHLRAGRRRADLRLHRPPGPRRRREGAARSSACWSSARPAGWGRSPCRSPRRSAPTVTGVCSTEKVDLVRSLGADDVIDYTVKDFADGTRRWDLIVDNAGRRSLSHLRRALTKRGTLVIVGGDGGGRVTGGFFRGVLRGPILSLFVGQKLRRAQRQGSGGRPAAAGRDDRRRSGHPRGRPDVLAGRGRRRRPRDRTGSCPRQGRRPGGRDRVVRKAHPGACLLVVIRRGRTPATRRGRP